MGLLDYIGQGIQSVQQGLNPQFEDQKKMIQDTIQSYREQTQSAGMPFPNTPVNLETATRLFESAKPLIMQRLMQKQQLGEQTQALTSTPPVPLDTNQFIQGMRQAGIASGQPISDDVLQKMSEAAKNNNGLGMRYPITPTETPFSTGAPKTLQSEQQNNQDIQTAKVFTPPEATQMFERSTQMAAAKAAKEARDVKNLRSPADNLMHDFAFDPATNGYTKDIGISEGQPHTPFSVYESGMRNDLINKGITDPAKQDMAIAKGWNAIELQRAIDLKGMNAANNVYDTQTGTKLPKVTLDQMTAEPGRYVSGSDWRVKAFDEVNKFDIPTRAFVSTIDKNVELLKKVESNYGGNQLAQILNTPINKVASLMGSGDYASIKMVLNSLANEIGKVESGSLGQRGVNDMQFRHYKESLNDNMPVGELLKVGQTAKELGQIRLGSWMEQRIRAKQSLGSPLNKEEMQYTDQQNKQSVISNTTRPPLDSFEKRK